MRFFFVMGAAKSGTTWVQAIYNAHPEVSCLGEGHFIEQVAHPMATLLSNYSKKLALVDEQVYSGGAPYRPFSSNETVILIRQMIVRLMQRAGADQGALWWGDKTPAYCRQIPALNQLFPGARFVHVVRDPRDVAVSALHHAGRAGVLKDVREPSLARQELIDNSIERWRLSVVSVAENRARLGERLLEIQYRTLVDNPHHQIRRLFAHLEGIAISDSFVARVHTQTSFEAMSGGRKQGQVNDRSFFRTGTHGHYAGDLTAGEIQHIEEKLITQMREYDFV